MLYVDENDKLKDYIGKFLFILSFFIFALMVYLIIQKPFFYIDEWFTKGLLETSFRGIYHLTSIDVHPPLYYFIAMVPVYILNHLHISYDMIFVMKMVSVVPYILLFAMSLTKIRNDYGWLAGGLFTFTLLSMCDFFSMFSIARMYPWGLLFLVMCFIYACEILKKPCLKNWMLLSIFAVLGAYTHYFVAVSSIIIYLLLFLNYLINNKSELKNWFISTIFGIICYIPWTLVLYKQMKTVHNSYWIKSITLKNFVHFFSSIFTFNNELILSLVLAAIFLALFILILIQYKNSHEHNTFELFGFLVFIGTVVFGVVASFVFKPIFITRYVTPATGIIWLVISIFISKYDVKKVVIPVVIVLLLFSAFNLYDQIGDISKNHDKLIENQKFLESINNNDSVVIIDGMVKYVHFHNSLNKTAEVYPGFSVGKQKSKGYADVFKDENHTFLMPNDFNKHKNKTIYLAYRNGADLDIPKNISKKKVGQVENCKFYKLKIKD